MKNLTYLLLCVLLSGCSNVGGANLTRLTESTSIINFDDLLKRKDNVEEQRKEAARLSQEGLSHERIREEQERSERALANARKFVQQLKDQEARNNQEAMRIAEEGSMVFTHSEFIKEYTPSEYCAAIYQAEGGKKAKKPYGVLSVKCEADSCRRVCENTVRNNFQRYLEYGHENYDTYIEFLASRYAPIGADNDPNNLNQNWIKNVSYHLGKNSL